MALSDEDVREILRLVDDTELDELRIETKGFRLHVVRGAGQVPPPAVAAPPPATSASSVAESPPPDSTADASAEAAPAPELNGAETIEAPMLGTFYRAESPGAAPYVEVGSEVEPGTVVCLVEVMKMMNSIRSEVAGTVVEICAENAELVEFGQPLFRVASSA